MEFTGPNKKNKMVNQFLKNSLAVVDYTTEARKQLFNLDDLINRLKHQPGKRVFLFSGTTNTPLCVRKILPISMSGMTPLCWLILKGRNML
jgi:hypothetical protein